MPFWSKKTEQTHTFSDIIRGIQHSVNTANEILEMEFVNKLTKYFNSDNSPILKTIKIDNKEVNIPIITLVSPNLLCIDELEIELKAQIKATEIKKTNNSQIDSQNDIQRTSFNMDFNPSTRDDNNATTIHIKFKSGVTPEGYSRIMDELHKLI